MRSVFDWIVHPGLMVLR